MSERLVVPLRYMETETHAELVKAQAALRGQSVSAYLRFIVRQFVDPDGETLKRAALVDPGVEYRAKNDPRTEHLAPPQHGRYRCDGEYTTEGE